MILATQGPSPTAQGLLYVLAFAFFLTSGIVAWFVPPILHKAVALTAWGLGIVMIVFLWVAFAAS